MKLTRDDQCPILDINVCEKCRACQHCMETGTDNFGCATVECRLENVREEIDAHIRHTLIEDYRNLAGEIMQLLYKRGIVEKKGGTK